MTERPTDTPTPSAWDPLRGPAFRNLWLASFTSNVGTLMHGVGAAWLMTSLSPSPFMVALVQTATTLPTFLLALPAGALADVLDRRRLLLVTQTWMLVSAAALGVAALFGLHSSWLLLLMTFSLGVGGALNAPAWQAIVPELVPASQLSSAIALNSAGFNLARAVGPALGGLIVARIGPAWTFLFNAGSFLAVLFVLFRWRRVAAESVLPAERVLGAMRSGLGFLAHSPLLQLVLGRTAGFMVFGSALWALLPVIAREELHLGAEGYGLLLGCLGLGAVAGAALLPRLRLRTTLDQRVALATVMYAVGSAVPAVVPNPFAVGAGLLMAGFAWLVLMSGFNTAVQSISPDWVRGRTISVYLLIVFGCLAVGSAVWGAVATWLSIGHALAVPAAGMVLALALTARWRLTPTESVDLAVSRHWPTPELAVEPLPDQGPVFVIVEYRIDPAAKAEFLRAMNEVRHSRLRAGAIRWNVLGDLANHGRYLESFMVESWLHHLRQHERVTVTDQAIEARAHAFHLGPEPPRVSHLLAEDLPG